MWENTNVFRVFVGQPEGRRPLRRPWCRLDEKDWTNVWVPLNPGNFLNR
jgi:hypothetical protein